MSLNYDELLNPTARDMKPSGIRKFFDLAGSMQDVVTLSIGEPDFKTPWHIREAGISNLNEGKTAYTPNAGLVPLRRAITSYMSRRFGLEYDSNSEVIVTVGGSEGIDITMRTVVASICPYHHVAAAYGVSTLAQVTADLLDYGCMIAYNLDGGRSCWMVFMGKIINRSRYLNNGWRGLEDMIGFLTSDLVPKP